MRANLTAHDRAGGGEPVRADLTADDRSGGGEPMHTNPATNRPHRQAVSH